MHAITVPVSYRQVWKDGFGARGWKLDCSIGDDSVIAATAVASARVATSVLIHDLLDHHLCGVAIGGHRNEAIALIQLAVRTGSDPLPDFRQIVNEDLLQGYVNGESMRAFLPARLTAMVPCSVHSGRNMIEVLQRKLGKEPLCATLVEHFWALGQAGAAAARQHFESLGLDYTRRRQMGECLQTLLVQADQALDQAAVQRAQGCFVVSDERCAIKLQRPDYCYEASVAA